jgi:hypothetical protein
MVTIFGRRRVTQADYLSRLVAELQASGVAKRAMQRRSTNASFRRHADDAYGVDGGCADSWPSRKFEWHVPAGRRRPGCPVMVVFACSRATVMKEQGRRFGPANYVSVRQVRPNPGAGGASESGQYRTKLPAKPLPIQLRPR